MRLLIVPALALLLAACSGGRPGGDLDVAVVGEGTLAEELAVVDDYLAIEAIHFEQRLQVRREIAAEAVQAQLPAMALQLLVENAIKHGIASRAGGGEVHIRASLEDDLLRLQVDNPLCTGSEPAHGHGVGLAYLRAQLGTRGRFTLQPVGDRMQALLEIPQ